MAYDAERHINSAAGELGCAALVAALIIVPPLILPAFVLYKLAVAVGASALHPAILIALAIASIWALGRGGGILVRSVSPQIARAIIAAYIGACYTFAVFQRQLTTARSELDIPWLLFGFAAFSLVGWKIAATVVNKAHLRQLARAERRNRL